MENSRLPASQELYMMYPVSVFVSLIHSAGKADKLNCFLVLFCLQASKPIKIEIATMRFFMGFFLD